MKYTFFLLAIAFFASCEQTVTDPEWPPFQERLVIKAMLQPSTGDSLLVTCMVRKTLPLQESYSEGKTFITDANVTIDVAGEAVTLLHSSVVQDQYQGRIRRVAGATYNLNVTRGAMHALSTLSLSAAAVVFDSLYSKPSDVNSYETVYIVRFTPDRQQQHAYAIQFEYLNQGRWFDVGEILYWNGNASGSVVRYLSHGQVEASMTQYAFPNDRFRTRMTLYNKAYYEYFNSRYNYYSGDPFDNEPTNPDFNVTGDGFGFFWYELPGEWVEFP